MINLVIVVYNRRCLSDIGAFGGQCDIQFHIEIAQHVRLNNFSMFQ